MKQIDLTKIIKKYTSGWVALSSDYKKVVGHGKTIKKAVTKLSRKELKNLLNACCQVLRPNSTLVKFPYFKLTSPDPRKKFISVPWIPTSIRTHDAQKKFSTLRVAMAMIIQPRNTNRKEEVKENAS